MDPITTRKGAWTISHVPSGSTAYDRVMGRITPWSLEVEHDTGWRIIEGEGERVARVVTPGGLLVGVITVGEFSAGDRPSLTTPRSDILAEALTTWVGLHAGDFDEPGIPG